MDTKLIDERINQLEAVSDLHEGTAAVLADDVISWLKEVREQILSTQKYTVQVFPGETGYLNIIYGDKIALNDSEEGNDFHTHFTQAEINEFKKRDDLAIDWDKAIIEPVKAEN